MSAMYKPLEDVFIQIGAGKDGGKDDPVFKLKRGEQQGLENFIQAREQALVWGKANVDVNMKPKIYDDNFSFVVIKREELLGSLSW